MTALLEYPPDAIKEADAPQLANAKTALQSARGEDFAPAKVELLRARYEHLESHIAILRARLTLATNDLATVTADLRFMAPGVLREVEGGPQ